MKPSFRNVKLKRKRGISYYISLLMFIASISAFLGYGANYLREMYDNRAEYRELQAMREQYGRPNVNRDLRNPTYTPTPTNTPTFTPTPTPTRGPEVTLPPLPNGDYDPTPTPTPTNTPTVTPTPTPVPPEMLELGRIYKESNPDYVGWLEIPGADSVINYPVVMERSYDEQFYLTHSFEGKDNDNGALFTVNECRVGVGSIDNNYYGGEAPTTNILIFGHNMNNGDMFGRLDKYLKQTYYEEHKYIYFDTAYEYRTYEVIAVIRSHEFEDPLDDNFKYYFFYNAETKEEFDYWYKNVKDMSKVKCKATASFGDQILTLSTCHKYDETGKKNSDGRLAVIAVRIR